MAVLTVSASPATQDPKFPQFVSILITTKLARERVEVSNLEQAKAAVKKVADALVASGRPEGWQVDGFIFDGDGRKFNGYDKARKARELTISKPKVEA